MAATDNPVSDGGPGSVEAVAGGDNDDKDTGAQLNEALAEFAGAAMDGQRQALALEAYVTLRLKPDTKSRITPGILAAATAALAEFHSTPCNWHQATVFFVVTANRPQADAADWRRMWLLLGGSYLQVVMQVLASTAILLGTIAQSCPNNDSCQMGMFCNGGQMCGHCGGVSPFGLPTDLPPIHIGENGLALNRGYATGSGSKECVAPDDPSNTWVEEWCSGDDFDGDGEFGWPTGVPGATDWAGLYNTTIVDAHCKAAGLSGIEGAIRWCDACFHAPSDTVDGSIVWKLNRDGIVAMASLDWMTLVLASSIVALAAVGELRDIEFCALTLRHAIAAPADAEEAATRTAQPSLQLRLALRTLDFLRKWIFLPEVITVVSCLVIFKGGDALSVCFNTVAVLFLLDIDNAAYMFLLDERTRARVERSGRVMLADDEAQALSASKMVHWFAITFAVLGAVLLVFHPNGANSAAHTVVALVVLPRFALMVGRWVEVLVVPAATPANVAQRICKSFGLAIVSIVVTFAPVMAIIMWDQESKNNE